MKERIIKRLRGVIEDLKRENKEIELSSVSYGPKVIITNEEEIEEIKQEIDFIERKMNIINTSELVYKGLSKCFVYKKEDIDKVVKIIKEIDEFEFGYIPENWVVLSSGNDVLNYDDYNGKFDLDIPKFIEACANEKISVNILSDYIEPDC